MRFKFLLFSTLFLLASCEDDTQKTSANAKIEKPFFKADSNATGPLTLKELDINFPKKLNFSDSHKKCILGDISLMIKKLGDPNDIKPHEHYFLENPDPNNWKNLSPYIKRVMSAQAVISFAGVDCS